MRCRFGHRRIEREEIVEPERRDLAVERQRAARRATQSSPDRRPAQRWRGHRARRASTMVRKRGSRPSARASFGRYAHANRVPEASSTFRRDDACGRRIFISAEIPASSPAAPRLACGFPPARPFRVYRPRRADRGRFRASASGSVAAASRPANSIGDVEPARHAVDPRRFDIGESRSAPAAATAARQADSLRDSTNGRSAIGGLARR